MTNPYAQYATPNNPYAQYVAPADDSIPRPGQPEIVPEESGVGARVARGVKSAWQEPLGLSPENRAGVRKNLGIAAPLVESGAAWADLLLQRPYETVARGAAGAVGGLVDKFDPGMGNRAERDIKQMADSALMLMGITPSASAVGAKAGRGAAAAGREMSDAIPSSAERAAVGDLTGDMKAADKARGIVEKRVGQDVAGGTDAEDATARLAMARVMGKPATLMDVFGENTRALGGRVGRAPGESRSIMRNFVEQRDKDAWERLTNDVGKYITSGQSAFKAVQDTLAERQAAATPLYAKAFEGGSMAPLEAQFGRMFGEATKAEFDAQSAVSVARNRLTQAEAAVARAGDDVYLNSTALKERAAATKGVEEAEHHASMTAEAKEAMRDRLQGAQEDRTAKAPGAVWNPRIQQFLDDPISKRGLSRGLEIQRLEALAENRPFDPTEYAIIGKTETGEPIAGKVPNMRSLDAVKKGLDAIIESEGRDDFGRLNQYGRSVDMVRRALLGELDRINPDYAAARASWAGHSASLDAIKFGKELLREGDKAPTFEEVAHRLASMKPSEREFARVGLADAMIQRIKSTGFQGDEAKAVVKNLARQERIRPLFNSDGDFQNFVDAVTMERQMFDTKGKVAGNSMTAEREAEDVSRLDPSKATQAAYAAGHLARGHILPAVGHGLRALRDLMTREDPRLNSQIARLLTDLDVKPIVSPTGQVQIPPPMLRQPGATP